MGAAWTVDETNTLIRLWPTHSSAQIAARLGKPRASVSGRVKRLGLGGADKRYVIWPPRTARPPGEGKPALVKPPAPPPPPDDALAMRPCTLLELDRTRCRWPLEDPGQFCGGVTVPRCAYCQHHLQMAHSQNRRRTA